MYVTNLAWSEVEGVGKLKDVKDGGGDDYRNEDGKLKEFYYLTSS